MMGYTPAALHVVAMVDNAGDPLTTTELFPITKPVIVDVSAGSDKDR